MGERGVASLSTAASGSAIVLELRDMFVSRFSWQNQVRQPRKRYTTSCANLLHWDGWISCSERKRFPNKRAIQMSRQAMSSACAAGFIIIRIWFWEYCHIWLCHSVNCQIMALSQQGKLWKLGSRIQFCSAMRKAVTAYVKGKQILPFEFARHSCCACAMGWGCGWCGMDDGKIVIWTQS